MSRIYESIPLLIFLVAFLSNCIQANQVALDPIGSAATEIHASVLPKAESSEVLFIDDETHDTDHPVIGSNHTEPIHVVGMPIAQRVPLVKISPPARPTVLRI